MITNLTARADYHQRLDAAVVALVARVQNGSQPLDVVPFIAKAHGVSETGLIEAYDREQYDVRGLFTNEGERNV